MDRMYEAYAIVTKASTEIAQSLSLGGNDQQQGYSFQ
jgi:hypothetical protein